MTRRLFFLSFSAAVLALAGFRARAASKTDTPPREDAWTTAREIVRSGALGRVIWGQVSAPTEGVHEDRALRRVLDVIGAQGPPRQVVRLGSGPRPAAAAGATTIIAFESGPPVFMAPGPVLEATIRGTRARLHIRNGQLRVVPTA